METEVKMSRWDKGWAMAKSAWHVFKLDKELSALPIIGFAVSLVALVPFGVMAALHTTINRMPDGSISGRLDLGQFGWVVFAGLYLILALISNFFAAALIKGAFERFEGKDPTIKSSLAGAWRRKGSIAGFTILSTTVGLVLQAIEERVPLGGRIATWLAGVAWAIATFFALPVIVTSDRPVGPIEAIRESGRTIKKIWGESIVAQLGVGLVGFMALLSFTLGVGILGIGLGTLGAALNASSVFAVSLLVGLGLLWVVGAVAIAFVFSVLGAIAKAAVFYYAKTGKSPVTFNKELLRAAMTPKKARRIFV